MRGLSRGRRNFRRGQSLVLFLLAMLTVTACAMGPFYERAVEQATLRSTLVHADPISRGLSIDVPLNTPTADVTPTGPAARLFGPAVGATDVGADFTGGGTAGNRFRLSTTITYRDNVCRHLTLTSGRCPTADREVVASASTARAVHLQVGQTLKVAVPSASTGAAVAVQLSVVGLYRPFRGDGGYWFGSHYSSAAGITVSSDATLADTFFGSRDYVAALADQIASSGAEPLPRSQVDVPLLADRITLDDVAGLRQSLARLDAVQAAGNGHTSVLTALPDLLDEVDAGRHDARTIVLAIAAQLALLALIALGVVAAAAADQRRPELALARLRGQGLRRTAGVFVREIGGLAVASAVPGFVAAYLLTLAACRVWLEPGVRPELRPAVLAATVGSLAVTLAVVAVIGYRASVQPISDMLRQVPTRVSSARVGVAEVGVAVAAIAGLVVSLSGDRKNVLSTLTPTFLAVLIGLALSRLVVTGGRVVGRRALWRGQLGRATAAISLSRRSGGRFTVTVLCVATAVVVFAGQQWGVAATNRGQRALAETGAPVVLDVTTSSGAVLAGAVRAADPTGRYATPVVVVRPPGVGAVPVVAIDPASFGHVASWGRPALAPAPATLARLRPTHLAPAISLAGSRITVQLASAHWTVVNRPDGSTPPSVGLILDLAHHDGRADQVTFPPLPAQGVGGLTQSAAVGCADGCRVTGLQLNRPVLDQSVLDITAVVTGLRADAPASIGSAADWASTTPVKDLSDGGGQESLTVTGNGAGVQFHAVDVGTGATAQHLDVPVAAPAVLSGAAPQTRDALGFATAATLDGTTRRIVVRGQVSFVPQVGDALLVDLDLAARSTQRLDPTAPPAVWLARDDPARERRLVASLQSRGVTVLDRRSSAAAAAVYSESAAGWSARLTLVVAAIAAVLGVALLILVVLTTRRVRQQDLAAMRLNGLTRRRLRRAGLLEFLVIVVLGVAGGTIAGLIAVRTSLPAIPIFATPATVRLPENFGLDPAWLITAVAVTAVLLATAGVGLARRLVSSARPQDLAGAGA